MKTWMGSALRRRHARVLLALAASLLAASAQAQTAIKSLGVFSFLGDSVQAMWSEDKPGASRIESRGAENLDFKGIGFDMIALRTSREVLKQAVPAARVQLYQSPVAMTPAEQRGVADGAARAELPGWLVKTLDTDKLTHLLLVTRTRGAIGAQTGNGIDIGRGMVEGIGFYMDTLYTMKNVTTGALSTGLLAPYTQIRLTLMDAMSGDILGTYDVRESFAYASPDTKAAADPWNFMPAAEKVRVLRELVESGVQRGVKEVLKKK
jgi:hypothetical protein